MSYWARGVSFQRPRIAVGAVAASMSVCTGSVGAMRPSCGRMGRNRHSCPKCHNDTASNARNAALCQSMARFSPERLKCLRVRRRSLAHRALVLVRRTTGANSMNGKVRPAYQVPKVWFEKDCRFLSTLSLGARYVTSSLESGETGTQAHGWNTRSKNQTPAGVGRDGGDHWRDRDGRGVHGRERLQLYDLPRDFSGRLCQRRLADGFRDPGQFHTQLGVYRPDLGADRLQ